MVPVQGRPVVSPLLVSPSAPVRPSSPRRRLVGVTEVVEGTGAPGGVPALTRPPFAGPRLRRPGLTRPLSLHAGGPPQDGPVGAEGLVDAVETGLHVRVRSRGPSSPEVLGESADPHRTVTPA